MAQAPRNDGMSLREKCSSPHPCPVNSEIVFSGILLAVLEKTSKEWLPMHALGQLAALA